MLLSHIAVCHVFPSTLTTMARKIISSLALIHAATAALDFSPCPDLNDEIATELSPANITTFDCANVTVPLDYTDPDSNSLDLNVFRVQATEEPVLGNVLINFGGPGGTGAQNLPALADVMRDIIGPQWNLISWDPRGTGKTIPFQCTPPTGLIDTTSNTKRDLGSLVSTNATEGFLNYGWDLAGDIADACAQQASETASLIGTAFVARDVMEIVDALDDGNLLHYYGWSYGTALGSYIAAMFPERVGRMVLDGNLNPHEYQSGTYAHAADDTDEAWDGFLETCFEAKDDCSLYSFVQPNTTSDLLSTINAAIRPLSLTSGLSLQSYLTYQIVKNVPISPLYFPRQWPQLADTLTLLLNSSATGSTANLTDTTTANTSTYDEAQNAVLGIRASDATFRANTSADYLPILRQQANASASFGDSFYLSLWVSARWQIPAKERYWGDFSADTHTPILYVNGEYDPVTPIMGAYNGSAGFAGSVVLAHSGYGHGLVASPSQCAAGYVRAYFRNATLPDEGTTCEPDSSTLEVWREVVQASSAAGNGTGGGGSSSSGSGDGQDGGNGDGGQSEDGDSDQGEGSGPDEQENGAVSMSGGWSATGTSVAIILALMIGSS